MRAPFLWPLTLSVALLCISCGSKHSRFTPSDAGSDGDGDGDADGDGDGDSDGDGDGDGDSDGDGDIDVDASLQCGDEREPLDIPPEPIVNGQETWDTDVVDLTEGQALAVGAVMSRDGGWSNSCTATLIAPNLVLTAAHCVTDYWSGRDKPPSQLRFAVGDDVSDAVYTFELDDVVSHPDYEAGWGGDARHDIGLLVLSENATSVVPEIQPIPANCEPLDSDLFTGQNVQNVGYGITEPWTGWDPPPDNSTKYWAVEEVIEITSYDFVVDGHGEAAVCSGDSGGPSLWTTPDGEIHVMGTVSWGDPSCVDLDHFARVDDSCDFIDGYLGDCGSVTETGFCDDARATYCEGGTIIEVDCGDMGLDCGEDEEGLMRCIGLTDPCDGETETGRCDEGGFAIWCENGELLREYCSDNDDEIVCGRDDEGNYRCIADSCGGVTWEGYCDGTDAIWCAGGQVRIRNCAECDQACGWAEREGGYYCI